MLDAYDARPNLDELVAAPHAIRKVLGVSDHVRHVARKHQRALHMLFLGRGTGYPIALEGALKKLKEISRTSTPRAMRRAR